MLQAISTLEPQPVWSQFDALNAIPRPSKKEDKVIEFMKNFGASLGLETVEDSVGNIVIKKPATKGMEDRKTVILQSHLDMVHQKNSGTKFDFESQGIKMLIDGDWVRAEGTTLGADNGLGVASAMAILASQNIPHPPIEALFTIDEETGMTGAKDLDGSMLSGPILLNLDTEDDDELTVGCAGGIDITGSGHYATMPPSKGYSAFEMKVHGLSGGHSGMDIHRGLGNANKLMNRLIFELTNQVDLEIASIDGGGLRNAIPRESKAIILVEKTDITTFKTVIDNFKKIFTQEYNRTDPELVLTIRETDKPDEVMDPFFQRKFIQAIYAIPNGIYRMSPDIQSLVQSSNNLARVAADDGLYSIQCLTRSSVDSEKSDLANAIASTLSLLGAKVKMDGEYPGWTPNPDSQILEVMEKLYVSLFNEKPHVKACHAGLECGILGRHLPNTEMISFGPNIRGAHSPDERAQISSVQKYWKFLKATLSNIPKI